MLYQEEAPVVSWSQVSEFSVQEKRQIAFAGVVCRQSKESMFKSMLESFQSLSSTGATNNPMPPEISQDEREEDGFLLIGETTSERSTITHQQFIAHQGIQSSANTQQTGVGQPPDYQTTIAKNMTELSPLGMDPVPSNNNHMLPISDIPFQLAPQLTVLQRLCMFTAEQGLQRNTFDWSKYNYDFNCELNYLKEHGIDHPLLTVVHREERDLIQF